MARAFGANRPDSGRPSFGNKPAVGPMYVLAVGYDDRHKLSSSGARPGSAHFASGGGGVINTSNIGSSSRSSRPRARPSSAARARSRHGTHTEPGAAYAAFGYGTGTARASSSQRPASAGRARRGPTRSSSSNALETPKVPLVVPRSSSAANLAATGVTPELPPTSARHRSQNRPASASATRSRTPFHIVQLGETLAAAATSATPRSGPSAASTLGRQPPRPAPVVHISGLTSHAAAATTATTAHRGGAPERRGSSTQIEVISLPRPQGIVQQDDATTSGSPAVSPSSFADPRYSSRIPAARPLSAHAGYLGKSANSASPAVEILVDGTVGRQENSQEDPFVRPAGRVRPSTAGYRRPGELQHEPTLLDTGSDSFEDHTHLLESPALPPRTIDSADGHKADFSSRSVSTVLNEITSPTTEMCQASTDTLLVDSASAPTICLSTVPNNYCTVCEAIELRPLVINDKNGEDKGSIDLYVVGKMLGIGSYGKVRLAWHRLTAEKVAVKSYDKNKLRDPAQLKRVQSEIKIMEKLSHPRIVRMFETIETPRRLHLVLECVEGSNLCSYVKAKRKVSEEEARQILFQLLQALEYIHSQHIAHRDIKLENVLFDEDHNIKLIDFGFSVACKDRRLKVFCGTPSYMAPEIVRRMDYEGPPVDMWSAGVVMYALLCGYFPFRGRSYPDLYRKICHGIFTIPDSLSHQARDLLRALLNLDPRRRLTAAAALKHPWMESCVMPDNKKLRAECAYLISEEPADDLHDDVLRELASYGLSVDDAKACVTEKKHNSVATLYYLLLASHAKKHPRPPLPFADSAAAAANTSAAKTVPPKPIVAVIADASNQAAEPVSARRYHRPRSAGIRFG